MKASSNYPIPDVIRLCAALLVVMYHLVGTNSQNGLWIDFFPGGNARPFYSVLHPIWFTGYIGVQIFFLISGYIISISVERASSGIEFFKNRLLRILPCLWLCSWIGAMLFFVFGLFPLSQIIQMYTHSALLLPSGPYVDGVIWTIMLELVFYLLVSLFIVVFDKKNLLYFGYFLITLSAFFWISATLFPEIVASSILMSLARRFLLVHGIYFGMGIVISRFLNARNRSIASLFTLAGILAGYLQISNSNALIYETYKDNGASSSCLLPFAFLVLSVVLLFISTKTAQSEISARFHNPARRIGLLTYPLYLTHFIAGNFVYAVMEWLFDFPRYLNTGIAIIAVLCLSFLISEYLETRLRKALQRTFTFAASAAGFIAVTAFQAIANARTKGEVLTAAMADETSVAMRENLMLPVGLEPSKLMKRKDA